MIRWGWMLVVVSSVAVAADPLAHRLPLRSDLLAPGPVVSQSADNPALALPLCIVGDDPRSLAWLRRNAERLRSVRATCFLTAVESPDGLRRVQRVATGISVVTASADQLAERYGVKHYPVLISKGWIEQ